MSFNPDNQLDSDIAGYYATAEKWETAMERYEDMDDKKLFAEFLRRFGDCDALSTVRTIMEESLADDDINGSGE